MAPKAVASPRTEPKSTAHTSLCLQSDSLFGSRVTQGCRRQHHILSGWAGFAGVRMRPSRDGFTPSLVVTFAPRSSCLRCVDGSMSLLRLC